MFFLSFAFPLSPLKGLICFLLLPRYLNFSSHYLRSYSELDSSWLWILSWYTSFYINLPPSTEKKRMKELESIEPSYPTDNPEILTLP